MPITLNSGFQYNISVVKRVAVIGASRDKGKFGNKAVRAFCDRGYVVVPINPDQTSVEGLKCYPSVLAVPGPIDLATIYVPAKVGQRVIREIAEKNIGEVWLNPGADDPDLVESAEVLGLRVIKQCSIIRIGGNPSMY